MQTSDRSLDFRRHLRTLRTTRLYVIAWVVLILALLVTYLCVHSSRYVSHAMLLPEEQTQGPVNISNAMLSLVPGVATVSAGDEMVILSSHHVMDNVVRRLQLTRTYTLSGDGSRRVVFDSVPARLQQPDMFFDTLSEGFVIRLNFLDDGSVKMKATRGLLLPTTLAESVARSLPAMFDTPLGSLMITPGEASPKPGTSLKIGVQPLPVVVERLQKDLTVDIASAYSDAFTLEYTSPDPKMGEAILNAIMEEYNAVRLQRRHDTAAGDIDFYNTRLEDVYSGLLTTEKDISTFKTANNLGAIEPEAEALMEQTVGSKREIEERRAEAIFYERAINMLKTQDDQLIPDGGDLTGSTVVSTYNEAVLRRRQLMESARPGNPALERANNEVASLRQAAIQALTDRLEATRLALNGLTSLTATAIARLQSFPENERQYVNMQRDQELKSLLYTYLLQQREEAVLRMYSQNAPGFVIDRAYTEFKPSMNRALLAVAIALLLIIVGVGTWLAVLTWRDRRVLEPKDLAHASLEDTAVAVDLSDKVSVGRLRAALIGTSDSGDIFISPVGVATHSTVARLQSELVESFECAGLDVRATETHSADDVMRECRHSAPVTRARYDIYALTSEADCALLSPMLHSDKSTLLLVVERGDKLRRVLKGAASLATRVVVAIVSG